jgi:hypothetical protein
MVQWLTVQGNRVYATFHNTSQTCSVLVGVATYMRFNNNIEDQQLFDFEQYLLAPGETRQLSAALPPCAYQADAFVGPVIVSFRGGVRYGDRLIDDIVRNGNWCRAGTGTPVPATRTPGTQTPGATRTQTPSSCDNCRLQIRDVTIHCNSDGTIHWTATVRNQNNNCSTVADWSIELQVREDEDGHDNGHWIGVQTQEGTTTFAPGDNTVSGDFCYRFSHDVERTRAEFSIDSPSRCRADRTSQTIEPCEHPADCSRN